MLYRIWQDKPLTQGVHDHDRAMPSKLRPAIHQQIRRMQVYNRLYNQTSIVLHFKRSAQAGIGTPQLTPKALSGTLELGSMHFERRE